MTNRSATPRVRPLPIPSKTLAAAVDAVHAAMPLTSADLIGLLTAYCSRRVVLTLLDLKILASGEFAVEIDESSRFVDEALIARLRAFREAFTVPETGEIRYAQQAVLDDPRTGRTVLTVGRLAATADFLVRKARKAEADRARHAAARRPAAREEARA